jgi:hypothetical protein
MEGKSQIMHHKHDASIPGRNSTDWNKACRILRDYILAQFRVDIV